MSCFIRSMVSFICDNCQATIKKPKVIQHFQSCYTGSVSCIDCSESFDSKTVMQHTQCISEAQKYQGKLYNGNKKQKTENKPTSQASKTIHQSVQPRVTAGTIVTAEPAPQSEHTLDTVIASVVSQQTKSISLKKLIKAVSKECITRKIDESVVDKHLMQHLFQYMVQHKSDVYIKYEQ